MKKNILILSCCIVAFVMPSCYRKLQKGYLEYIPYSGNEILIFQSDRNRMDTIFLKGISVYNSSGGKEIDLHQRLTVFCTRTDPNYDRYLNNKVFVEIIATKDGGSRISFDIKMKDSWFYDKNDDYGLDEFKDMPDSKLTIGDKTYSDVKIFEATEYAKKYEHRDNYADRFYWSFSEGFLGLDKKDEKWRLIKKNTSL